MRQWRAFMCSNLSEDEVDGEWIAKYYAEDRPAKLTDHLEWLKEAGFSGVDVLLKIYTFAVYGGIKK
jgi:tRNA (cmo5U34)-methyltransferase